MYIKVLLYYQGFTCKEIMLKKVYLDHNATTPVYKEVVQTMLPFLEKNWGNPSSIHWASREPRRAVDEAREKVAALINAQPNELVFTGSGSEGNNFAIKGLAQSPDQKRSHIVVSSVEHSSVLNTCKYLAHTGFSVDYLKVDAKGMIAFDTLKNSITDKTVMISVMHANNETGNIYPIEKIGELARERGVLFHCDAVQAAGKTPIDVKKMNVDLLTLSGHKLYAPKGIGALYIRRGVKLLPLIHGGHHERNRRAGTENVAGIVGFGKACEIATAGMDKNAAKLTKLRDRLQKGILERIDDVTLHGHPAERLPTTLNLGFDHVDGESLLLSLDMKGIAASAGSACTSGSVEPSHVLLAMGVPMKLALGSVRFSLGTENSVEDIDYLLDVLPPIVERIRSMSPLYRSKSKSEELNA
jgi:cysteine desulfurase